jgi:ABC-type sulfate transport system permease subunit
MVIVSIGWVFVVAAFALAQVTAPGGTLLGALLTLVFGLAPLVVVIYIASVASRRRRAQRAASAADPDRGGHAAGDAVATKREEA